MNNQIGCCLFNSDAHYTDNVGGRADQGVPVVIIDGPSGMLKVGEELKLTCYALKSVGTQVQWLKDGKLLPDGGGEILALTIFTG